MSKSIWKFPLSAALRQQIDIEPTDRVLCVQMQYGKPMLWAIVDREQQLSAQTRAVTIVGTGHDIPDDAGDYVGTIQDGVFVGHVFVAKGAVA